VTTGSTVVAAVPLPPMDPRQRSGGASASRIVSSGGGFSLGRLFGFRDENNSEAKFQPAAVMPVQAAPVPQSPPRTQAVQAPVRATRPVQTATPSPTRPAPASQAEQEKPATPAPMPGATPILSTGGFSYN
jgi:hypothetical protein